MMTECCPWKKLRLEIESRLDAVPLLGQVVQLLSLAAGFTPPEACLIEVCVVEAANNSIEHAYREDPNHSVEVEMVLLPDLLILDVFDSGISGEAARMNADRRDALDCDPDQLTDLAEGGRGLAVIQGVMDTFEYTASPGRNRFRMTKRRVIQAACLPAAG